VVPHGLSLGEGLWKHASANFSQERGKRQLKDELLGDRIHQLVIRALDEDTTPVGQDDEFAQWRWLIRPIGQETQCLAYALKRHAGFP
jgi:hypothetical protein